MEQLPPDLLYKVLCCLPLSHHKLGLQLVCKKWRDALRHAESHALGLDDEGIPEPDDPHAYTIAFDKTMRPNGGVVSASLRPLPGYLLKVLPSAAFCCVRAKLAAGGLEHILVCDGVPSEPTTLPNVRTLELRHQRDFLGFTPQRFPSLRKLVIHFVATET